MEGVLTTGMGWWLPEASAPWFGARDVNISSAMSYSGPWDDASGSADTRAIACRIVGVSGSLTPSVRAALDDLQADTEDLVASGL
jgi:hypothetical protein